MPMLNDGQGGEGANLTVTYHPSTNRILIEIVEVQDGVAEMDYKGRNWLYDADKFLALVGEAIEKGDAIAAKTRRP